MDVINIADFFISFMQGFLIASLACRHLKIKYSYKISMVIHVISLQLQYMVMNYGIFSYELRATFGVICFSMMSLIIFEGTFIKKILLGAVEYAFLIVLDFLAVFFVYPWMGLSHAEDMLISARLLLARNVFNVFLYLLLMLTELWRYRKRESLFKVIVFLASGFGICQLFAMKNLYQANSNGVTESAVVVSAFYTGIVIIGYFVVMELFEQILKQHRKQAEMERMMMERQYQFDYYQKAYEQGEKLRDMRHDMRNQLQTVGALMQSDVVQDKMLAKEMMDGLAQKIGRE